MPWEHCNTTLLDDQDCPTCGITKEAWTLEWNVTRTFQVSRKPVVRVALLDSRGEPLQNEPFEAELSDGESVRGELDRFGFARIPLPEPGTCVLRFPERERLERGVPAPGEDGAATPVTEGFECRGDVKYEFRLPTPAVKTLAARVPEEHSVRIGDRVEYEVTDWMAVVRDTLGGEPEMVDEPRERISQAVVDDVRWRVRIGDGEPEELDARGATLLLDIEPRYAGASLTVEASAGEEWTYLADEVIEVPPASLLHSWQEYHAHQKPGELKSLRGNTSDRRVVEGAVKETLHLCFLESAIATIEVPAGRLSWRITGSDGEPVLEHPKYGTAKKVKAGKYAWRWDGRAGSGRLCDEGEYHSEVELETEDGLESSAVMIRLRGNPYHVYAYAIAKNDEELWAQYLARDQAWLGKNGRRMTEDCWILVWRGRETLGDAKDGSHDGHVVFLSHGMMEATGWTSAKLGAVATPHRAEPEDAYFGWIGGGNSRINMAEDEHFIRLRGASGLPLPGNPYSDRTRSGPVKDGVQAHKTFRTGAWANAMASLGCTTISPVGEVELRSLFNKTPSAGADETFTNAPAFRNKQSGKGLKPRRGGKPTGDDPAFGPADALLEDSHENPRVGPYHMQDTFRAAVIGGFTNAELPRDSSNDGDLKIHIRLEPYIDPEGASRSGRVVPRAREGFGSYYTYHHAVVFAHDYDPLTGIISVWAPYKVIRGWNGEYRNLRVERKCDYAWYVVRREDGGESLEEAFFGGPTTWHKGKLGTGVIRSPRPYPIPPGPGQLVSVLRYRVALAPPHDETTNVWLPELAMADALSSRAAGLIQETVAGRFLTGRSELILRG